jgi:hypothetical protein
LRRVIRKEATAPDGGGGGGSKSRGESAVPVLPAWGEPGGFAGRRPAPGEELTVSTEAAAEEEVGGAPAPAKGKPWL